MAQLEFQKSILESQAGATRQALTKERIEDFRIAAPPIAEQKRIAGILKELFAAVERARAAAEVQLQAVKSLPAAYVNDAFDTDRTKEWPRATVNDLRRDYSLIEHQDGNHGELHPRTKDFVASGVKFVTAKHFTSDGSLDLSAAPHIAPAQASGLRIGFAEANDVLLAHNATVGPVAMAPSNCEPFIVGTSVTIYRAAPEKLAPRFVFWMLKSKIFQDQLLNAMKQTTRNQVPITRQREFILLIPPVQLQQSVAEHLDVVMQSVHATGTAIAAMKSEIQNVSAALLRSAFQGLL